MTTTRPGSLRARRAARLLAGGALLALVSPLLATTAGAQGGGEGEYSPPNWFPLRASLTGGDIRVGCTYLSDDGPIYDCNGHHAYWALDLGAAIGTPVFAAGAGEVVTADDPPGAVCGGAARTVKIDHGDGVLSYYTHLSEVDVVVGDWVGPDTKIGEVGNTGAASCSFPHLHYSRNLFPFTHVDPGPLRACHGEDLVTYPEDWGLTTWQGIPWGVYFAHSDGTDCASPPAVTVRVADAKGPEGTGAATTKMTFRFVLSEPVGADVTIDWVTADGTATAPQDYLAASRQSVIRAGLTKAKASVRVKADHTVEPDETFAVRIVAVSGATVGDSEGVGRIRNDD